MALRFFYLHDNIFYIAKMVSIYRDGTELAHNEVIIGTDANHDITFNWGFGPNHSLWQTQGPDSI